MSFEKACEECGVTFVAQRATAKFHSATCRVRANRRPTKTGRAKFDAEAVTADVVQLRPGQKAKKAQQAEKSAAGSTTPPPQVDGVLVEQIRASLEKAGALETIAGASALLLARQMERGQESGSAVASMTKELSRLVVEAKAEAGPRQQDAADDVMARAAAKLMRLVGEPA